jgi:hypothetical protein
MIRHQAVSRRINMPAKTKSQGMIRHQAVGRPIHRLAKTKS